jgi:hypothetical protein
LIKYNGPLDNGIIISLLFDFVVLLLLAQS